MTSSEKRWIYLFGFLVMGFTSLPYLFGMWTQGADWRFSGFLLGVEDGNSYLAKMLSGSSGEWLFKTPYTAYTQNGFLAFIPYLMLGKLAAAPAQHEQLTMLFQIFRWIAGLCMILATYQFIAYFVKEPRYRKLGTALATIGGGLGWLTFLGLQQFIWGERIPLEFYSPETFGFLSIFTLPHLAMGRALLLWGLLFYWRAFELPHSWKRNILAGLTWLGLALMQPMTVLIGWMIIGLDGIIRVILARKRVWRLSDFWKNGMVLAASLIIFSAPIVIYTIFSFLGDPFLRTWSEQNIILSPPPVDYFFAYGMTLPFVIVGVRKFLTAKNPENIVLLAWICLLPVLAYFPYNLQRRLPEGIWTAFCILAVVGLCNLPGMWKKAGNVVLYSSYIMSGIILAGSMMAVFTPNEPIYQPKDEIAAFQFLSAHTSGFPVVLAAYRTANVMPAYAAVRTLIGHGPESIHLKATQPRVEAFYSSDADDLMRRQLINEFSIRYIFWGPSEKELGKWEPSHFSDLTRVFQNATCEIFEVVQ